MMTTTDLSTTDIAERTGLTYRQLDWWCRQGYLGADKMNVGSGGRRQWSERDASVLRAIRRTLDLMGATAPGGDQAHGTLIPAMWEALHEGSSFLAQNEHAMLLVNLDAL